MNLERREIRSENPWLAVGHLLAKRAPEGALLADDQGLPLVAHGLPQDEAERQAAELLRADRKVASVRTGFGLDARIYAPSLAASETHALAADLGRILAQV